MSLVELFGCVLVATDLADGDERSRAALRAGRYGIRIDGVDRADVDVRDAAAAFRNRDDLVAASAERMHHVRPEKSGGTTNPIASLCGSVASHPSPAAGTPSGT